MSTLRLLVATLPLVASLSFAQGTQGDGTAGQDRGGRRGGGFGRFSPARQFLRAADANRDGAVAASEWRAYKKGLAPDETGAVEADAVRASVLVSFLDWTSDNTLATDDLFVVFEAIDKNADYLIESSELPAASRGGGTNNTRGAATLYMASLPIRFADGDRDGLLTEEEWGAFIDGLEVDGDGVVARAHLIEWMDWIEEAPGNDVPFSIGSWLKFVTDGVDANKDGAVDLSDVQQYFDELDIDANGTIAADELAFNMNRDMARGGSAGREPLMPWQRNLDDALALVEATGKPLLICVNMDDEFASESLAMRRYRDPEFVKLAEGFVPILVSPNRRNPRDHDDRGRRIPDAKFGRVLNSEHIDIEPIVGERYFGDQRVAPRHVGVGPDGEILFDIFLVNDLTVVDEALREHGLPGAAPRDPSEMTDGELLASPDALHRAFLEAKFVDADETTRAGLAGQALSDVRATQHLEVLRLGLHDPSPAVRRAAAWNLAQHPRANALEFIDEAYAACANDAVARGALLGSLSTIAKADSTSTADRALAARLLAGFQGIERSSEFVDTERWLVALSWGDRAGEPDAAPREELIERLDRLEKRLANEPDSSELRLAFAATAMEYAQLEIRSGNNPSFLFEDVIASARLAGGARGNAFVADASYQLSRFEEAMTAAEEALPGLLPWAGSSLAVRTLEVFAAGRARAVYGRMAEGAEIPAAWIADACSAYDVLVAHPLGTETHASTYVDFLDAVGVVGEQERVLTAALARFPTSGTLNAYWRANRLARGGAAALERAYGVLEAPEESSTAMAWYEGLALLVAAERRVENQDKDGALADYVASIEHFRASMDANAEYQESSSHYRCLALAGAARIHMEKGELERASELMREAILSNEESAWLADGLGNKPYETATVLHAALLDAGSAEPAEELLGFLAEHGIEL